MNCVSRKQIELEMSQLLLSVWIFKFGSESTAPKNSSAKKVQYKAS